MNTPTGTKKKQRHEKGQRYSTIDLHEDSTADGSFEIRQKAPFVGRVIAVVLTPLAKRILKGRMQEKE